MRSLLKLAMTEEGYRVAEAKNAEECLIEYHRLQPDMVLLDAVLPEMNGFTCCERLRQLPNNDRLPILMLTVLDTQESVEQAFAAGATDFITLLFKIIVGAFLVLILLVLVTGINQN